MALNGTEALIIAETIGRLPGRPKVLSLAYPDLLFPPALVSRYLPQITRQVSLHPASAEIAMSHGHPELSAGILDTSDFFDALGATLDVVDFADLGHQETILDLNNSIPPAMAGGYDIILDPGTIEHVFNVAQAMANVVHLCRPGGYIYHQAAISFVNHGFFSFSPCFFVDFYASNHFEVAEPYCWHFGGELGAQHEPVTSALTGFLPADHRLEDHNFVRYHPIVGVFLARKPADWAGPVVWPIQGRYGNPESHDIRLQPWVRDVLAGVPGGIHEVS